MAVFDTDPIVQTVRRWVDGAVIGLNLCPFAKAVQVKGQIRYVVSDATEAQDVLQDLSDELAYLANADPLVIDTTLLIVPHTLSDFYAFNAFEVLSERLLKRMRLTGQLQIAAFHPAFQFAGSEPDDVENCTNRSPYPILHLLREDSIDRAVQAFPDAADIYEKNMATLRKLGVRGWRALSSLWSI